jgi:hypothetical protein
MSSVLFGQPQQVAVDGVVCEQFAAVPLRHLNQLEVGGLALVFMCNLAATQRLLRRMARASALAAPPAREPTPPSLPQPDAGGLPPTSAVLPAAATTTPIGAAQ